MSGIGKDGCAFSGIVAILLTLQIGLVVGNNYRPVICQHGEALLDGYCYSSCPDHMPLNSTMDTEYPSSSVLPQYTCLSQCYEGYYQLNNTCIKTCPPGQYVLPNQTCVKNCPKSYYPVQYEYYSECLKYINFTCSAECENGDIVVTDKCLTSRLFLFKQVCFEFCSGNPQSMDLSKLTLCKKEQSNAGENISSINDDSVARISNLDWNTGQFIDDRTACYPICKGIDNLLPVFCPLPPFSDVTWSTPAPLTGGHELALVITCTSVLVITLPVVLAIYFADCICRCGKRKEHDIGQRRLLPGNQAI